MSFNSDNELLVSPRDQRMGLNDRRRWANCLLFIADWKGARLIEKVKEAIAAGASINDDSRNGHRPLQLALARGYTDVAQFLIEQGSDPNYRDRSGLTPLQTAVNHGQFKNARLLIKKGAAFNPHAPNLGFDQIKLYQFIH